MQRIRNIADDLFVRFGLKLPLSFEQLKKTVQNMGWKIYAYTEAKELIAYLESCGHTDIQNYEGFTYKADNDSAPIILYRNDLSYIDKIKIICHEIGHIVLDHNSFNGVLGKSESSRDENAQEKEADIFALEFQAPVPVLRQMDWTSVDDIAKNGLLTRRDARKQKLHMISQTASKRKGVLISIAAVIVALWVGVILHQQGIIGGGNGSTEPTTLYGENILDDEKKTQTVYITQSGNKYHESDCQYVKYNTSVTELTLGEAVEQGYTACKVCNP